MPEENPSEKPVFHSCITTPRQSGLRQPIRHLSSHRAITPTHARALSIQQSEHLSEPSCDDDESELLLQRLRRSAQELAALRASERKRQTDRSSSGEMFAPARKRTHVQSSTVDLHSTPPSTAPSTSLESLSMDGSEVQFLTFPEILEGLHSSESEDSDDDGFGMSERLQDLLTTRRMLSAEHRLNPSDFFPDLF